MAWDWFKGIFDMRKPTLGDIRVVGLVPDKHTIEDISVNVPYGMTATIPAEMAVRSKDLWAAINQHRVLKLDSKAPVPKFLPPTALNMPDNKERERLEAKVRELTEKTQELQTEVQGLRTENQSLRTNLMHASSRAPTVSTADPELGSKLDAIMAAIKSGIPASGKGFGEITVRGTELADGEAPTFLPSQIRPDDADVRIDIQGQSSESSSVTSAAERLRKLRKTSR